MPAKKRRFTRPLGERRYRKLFVIAVEGSVTEYRYFDWFNRQQTVIHVECLKSGKASAPQHVLKRMEKHIKSESLKKTDEAWLVVDKDNWTDQQLKQLYSWSLKKDNYGIALSNPNFEFWLLLHFEDGKGIVTARDCKERLKRYLPNYDKDFDIRKIKDDNINEAVRRAKVRDNPPCTDWPKTVGTTVYRLVDSILKGNELE
ncbi:MAG: RloB domain-containing protein [Spirochaetales bacterium]|nr:RloB domain-containing protein [Spirochaetales bacterium]